MMCYRIVCLFSVGLSNFLWSVICIATMVALKIINKSSHSYTDCFKAASL